jgi:hypothetical protein
VRVKAPAVNFVSPAARQVEPLPNIPGKAPVKAQQNRLETMQNKTDCFASVVLNETPVSLCPSTPQPRRKQSVFFSMAGTLTRRGFLFNWLH